MELDLTKATKKVADSVNAKRRSEVFNLYQNKPVFDYLSQLRRDGVYNKGNKSKSMKLLASIPIELDIFFSRVYGEDYFKDPDFFTKRYSEWNVNDYQTSSFEESQQNVKEMWLRSKGEDEDKSPKLDATR